MSASAEFITNTVFAAVMVMIGLGAIWIVRWQTYFLLRHQNQDLECGGILTGSSVHQIESIELASLTQPSIEPLDANENAGLDVDGNSSETMDSRPVSFPTSSTTPANIRQKPGAGILDNHQPTKNGPSVFRSGISGCGLTSNQITGSDSAVGNRPALSGVSIPSNAALPGDIAEESPKIDETSFRTPENVQGKTRNME